MSGMLGAMAAATGRSGKLTAMSAEGDAEDPTAGSTVTHPWRLLLEGAGRLADTLDHARTVPVQPERRVPRPGAPAALWAAAKAAAGLAGLPVTLPTLAWLARRAQQVALDRVQRFPDHLLALAEGRPGPLSGSRVRRVPADRRYVITSDLHRCIPGRLDWPARQRTKELYRAALERYAEEGWTLVENGDVEDFWMVGGSTWGTVYDVARLAGGVAGPLADGPRRDLLAEHLDRIVDNNAALYRLLRDGFAAEDRYLRIMGNHDDVYEDPGLVAHLARHLPGTEVVDAVLVGASDDAGWAAGIDSVEVVVMHGHLTDAWNGPGLAALGRTVTWWATGLDDLPLPATANGLPDESSTARLLAGRARNRLISVDPRFGGNRRGDSLDEVRLFARLDETRPEGGWPWLVFGHTHLPMLWPLDPSGHAVRYANSGSGVLAGGVTAVEWDPAGPEPLRLVLWHLDDGSPRRVPLLADGARLVPDT